LTFRGHLTFTVSGLRLSLALNLFQGEGVRRVRVLKVQEFMINPV